MNKKLVKWIVATVLAYALAIGITIAYNTWLSVVIANAVLVVWLAWSYRLKIFAKVK